MSNGRRNVLILSFTLVVVMLGYGMVMPILPFYVESMGAGGSELGLLVASYALMRLIFGPIWGSLSDRVGRKPILMVGVFGYALAMIFFGLAARLWMLFAARILSGVLSSATSPTTMAYVGDSTSEEERGRGMGMLGGAVGLGAILGPALGGLLATESLSVPFFLAAGLSLLSVLLIFALLPESRPANPRAQARTEESGSPLKQWRLVLSGPIGILLIMAFLVTSGMTVFYGVFGLYALEQLGYGPDKVGAIMMVMGLASAVAQGGLSGPLTKRWGESAVIKGASLVSAIGFLLLVPADTFLTVLAATGLFVLASALLMPAVSALTSRRAPMEQGITMGVSNSFMSLGRIVGPLLGGVLFDLDVRYPYLSGAAIMLVGFLVAFACMRRDERVGST